MTDAELFALCLESEAGGESTEGKRAVAQVILNRMERHYQSDGTVAGTILHLSAFSGFWFSMIDGHYVRDCHTLDEAKAKAETMLIKAKETSVWPMCVMVAAQALGGDIPTEPALSKAILYYNPKISNPVWADPAKEVAAIGQHVFLSA